MIQDIAPHRLYNEYQPEEKATDDSILLFFNKKQILMRRSGDELRFPRKSEFSFRNAEDESLQPVFLFRMDEEKYFLITKEMAEKNVFISLSQDGTAHFQFVMIDQLRKQHLLPKHQVFSAITAYQLNNWYTDNRFCGTCGSGTELSKSERAIRCPECGRVIYPRIVPAVIVGVTNGDEILVTKYAGRDIPFYALIAGFTEIGETLEETVEREVMEEVGLKVKNIRYYKSQPWGIVDDLLAGFYCDVDGDTRIHLDRTELKVGEWKKRDEVVLQPDDFSLTNEMMLMFKEGKEPR